MSRDRVVPDGTTVERDTPLSKGSLQTTTKRPQGRVRWDGPGSLGATTDPSREVRSE